MSFDKEYPNRKDHRKKYRKSKSFDRNCRNHGCCSYCQSDREHSEKRRRYSSLEQIKEWQKK